MCRVWERGKIQHHPPNILCVTLIPTTLIGLHALACMWPNEFNRFKQATCANLVKPFIYDKSKQCSEVIEANKIQSMNVRETKQKPKPKTSLQKGSKSTLGNSAVNPAGKGFRAQKARAAVPRVHEPRAPPSLSHACCCRQGGDIWDMADPQGIATVSRRGDNSGGGRGALQEIMRYLLWSF